MIDLTAVKSLDPATANATIESMHKEADALRSRGDRKAAALLDFRALRLRALLDYRDGSPEIRRDAAWRVARLDLMQMGLSDHFDRLCLAYKASPHLGDEAFLRGHGRKHHTTLIARREEILRDFNTKVLCGNLEAVRVLETVTPELWRCLTWEVQALRFADEFDALEDQERADHKSSTSALRRFKRIPKTTEAAYQQLIHTYPQDAPLLAWGGARIVLERIWQEEIAGQVSAQSVESLRAEAATYIRKLPELVDGYTSALLQIHKAANNALHNGRVDPDAPSLDQTILRLEMLLSYFYDDKEDLMDQLAEGMITASHFTWRLGWVKKRSKTPGS